MSSKELREIQICALREDQLAEASGVMSLAFGTHLGVPEPSGFLGDIDFVHGRFHADPSAAFAANGDGQLIGAAFASYWGSVGFFGPLIVHPDYWNRGVAQQLMQPLMGCFERWGTQHAGLYTFANSTRHIGLYQKFGFWPRYLTAILAKEVQTQADVATELFSATNMETHSGTFNACAALTNSIYNGLDVRREILAVNRQSLGDTLMLRDAEGLAGFAVCHCGAGSEAGSGRCYVKFAAVRSGHDAEKRLTSLLQSCEQYAVENNAALLSVGVSVGRSRAYGRLLQLGFRLQQTGIAMHRPNSGGYDHENAFVLDDWR